MTDEQVCTWLHGVLGDDYSERLAELNSITNPDTRDDDGKLYFWAVYHEL